MLRRKKSGYFETVKDAPAPCKVVLKKRVNFNEADIMGIVWHGNYPKYFEEASAELGIKCGLSYRAFYEARIQSPIVQMHIDYHNPLVLGEEFTVEAAYIWSEGARLHTEFGTYRSDGSAAATGYTVQMFMDAVTKEPLLTSPPLLEKCRERWRAGDFK
jgi:acyl-CoA thioester hydrolase